MNLKTLDGIGEAREVVFEKLMAGEMPETRAKIAEMMLRGQQNLKGDLRLKALALFGGNKKFEPFVIDLADGITKFVNGPAVALTEGR